MSSKLKIVTLLCTFGLLAAACGGGNGDADLIAAIQASMDADSQTFDGLDFDTECGAESFVNAVGGAEGAEERYGITVDNVDENSTFDFDLSQPDAEAFIDSFWECGDIMAAMTAGITEEGISDTDAACITENLDGEIFKTGLVAEFMGDAGAQLAESSGEEVFSAIFAAMGTCNIDLGSLGG